MYFQYFKSVVGYCGQWNWAKIVIVCRRVFRVRGDLSPLVELLMVFSGFILTGAKKFIARTICRDTFLIRRIYTGLNVSSHRIDYRTGKDKSRARKKSETPSISGVRYGVAVDDPSFDEKDPNNRSE